MTVYSSLEKKKTFLLNSPWSFVFWTTAHKHKVCSYPLQFNVPFWNFPGWEFLVLVPSHNQHRLRLATQPISLIHSERGWNIYRKQRTVYKSPTQPPQPQPFSFRRPNRAFRRLFANEPIRTPNWCIISSFCQSDHVLSSGPGWDDGN